MFKKFVGFVVASAIAATGMIVASVAVSAPASAYDKTLTNNCKSMKSFNREDYKAASKRHGFKIPSEKVNVIQDVTTRQLFEYFKVNGNLDNVYSIVSNKASMNLLTVSQDYANSTLIGVFFNYLSKENARMINAAERAQFMYSPDCTYGVYAVFMQPSFESDGLDNLNKAFFKADSVIDQFNSVVKQAAPVLKSSKVSASIKNDIRKLTANPVKIKDYLYYYENPSELNKLDTIGKTLPDKSLKLIKLVSKGNDQIVGAKRASGIAWSPKSLSGSKTSSAKKKPSKSQVKSLNSSVSKFKKELKKAEKVSKSKYLSKNAKKKLKASIKKYKSYGKVQAKSKSDVKVLQANKKKIDAGAKALRSAVKTPERSVARSTYTANVKTLKKVKKTASSLAKSKKVKSSAKKSLRVVIKKYNKTGVKSSKKMSTSVAIKENKKVVKATKELRKAIKKSRR